MSQVKRTMFLMSLVTKPGKMQRKLWSEEKGQRKHVREKEDLHRSQPHQDFTEQQRRGMDWNAFRAHVFVIGLSITENITLFTSRDITL